MDESVKRLIGSKRRDIILFARKQICSSNFYFTDVDGEYIDCDEVHVREEFQCKGDKVTSYQQKMFGDFLKADSRRECYVIQFDWEQFPCDVMQRLNEYRLQGFVLEEYAKEIRKDLISLFKHASVYKYNQEGDLEKVSDNYYEWHTTKRGGRYTG